MNLLSLSRRAFSASVKVARIHGSKRDKPKGRGVDVNADDVVGCDPSQFWGDKCAQITPLSSIVVVTEPAHQLSPGFGGAIGAPSRFMGRPGEAEAGKRRDHEVQGVRWISTLCAW